jgi:AraC family transcriptional regulator
MPDFPEIDGDLSPGDRRLRMWKRRLAPSDRRILAAVENLHSSLWIYTSVSDLARSVNMSRWHFSHLFKAQMSQSPSQYMKTLRMQEAQRILSETFLSVKEISTMLGNIDRSHFSREFKAFCGLSPTEFRKRLNASQPQDPTRYAST